MYKARVQNNIPLVIKEHYQKAENRIDNGTAKHFHTARKQWKMDG